MNCNAQKELNLKEVTYEAFTRGSNIELKITTDSIIYTENQKAKRTKIKSDTWNKIKKLVSKIDLSKIENFSSPTENRNSDKAMHASLKVDVNNVEHVSQTFDHGNPPIALKPLVDFLFKIAEIK